MIPWWAALAAFVIGEMTGIMLISVCAANEHDEGREKHGKREGDQHNGADREIQKGAGG